MLPARGTLDIDHFADIALGCLVEAYAGIRDRDVRYDLSIGSQIRTATSIEITKTETEKC